MAQAAGRARAVAGEDALNDERVEVDVQVRRRPEALDRGDGPTAAVGGTATPRATSLEGQHRTDEHSEHAPAEPLVVRERVAQPVRRGEHPLPYGKAAKHVVHEVGGEACHATRRARRAEAAALAGERDQKVGATRVAAEAGEAARELAAGQELPQLALDEVRQAVTVTASTRLGEKGLQVLVDEPVQRAELGRARAVAGRREPRGICGDDSARTDATGHGREDCGFRAGRTGRAAAHRWVTGHSSARARCNLASRRIRNATFHGDADRVTPARFGPTATAPDAPPAGLAASSGRPRLTPRSYPGRKTTMATAEKISVSVSRDDLAWARKRARARRTSLSAVVSEALLRQRQAEAGVRLLEDLGTEDITEGDLDAIRSELGWAPKRKGRGSRPQTRAR
jgi:hypothetical protein